MTEPLALIGADPEVFLKIKGTDFFVPSTDLIGGNKENPLKVNKGALQEDNVTAEFNIAPTSDPDEFVATIGCVMDQLQDKVGANLELSIQSTADFSKELLEDPRTKEIGCDPDYNAYTKQQNKYLLDYERGTTRYAGGHIHLGAKEIVSRPQELIELVKMMDAHVGAALAILDPDTSRHKHYGQAGNYRVKPYGIEYRTASNFWLSSKELTRDIHLLSQRAFHLWNTGEKIKADTLQRGINHKNRPCLYSILPVPVRKIVNKYS